MADHGTVEYATAAGNDYPAHESGTIHVINLVLGLATGGVLGHWLTALLVFIIAVVGLIPGLVTGGKTSSYVAFALCFFIFAFTALSGH
jgi:hypothetical protein